MSSEDSSHAATAALDPRNLDFSRSIITNTLPEEHVLCMPFTRHTGIFYWLLECNLIDVWILPAKYGELLARMTVESGRYGHRRYYDFTE